jgi:predicted DNA-binding transcriptional regulator YafY
MTERKRLVADRFRRIWYIVEDIAAHPGKSRRNLADKFHLSERQVQADLNIIRCDIRLPLVRRQGYRFADEGTPGGDSAVTLQDAQTLVMVLRLGLQDRSIPTDRVRKLMAKVPGIFPCHLQPLVALTIDAVSRRPDREQRVIGALGDALLRGSWVQLHYPLGDLTSPLAEPIIRPELLLPYLRSWYVVGEVQQRKRSMMLNIDAVTAVTLQADVEPAGVRR